MSTNHRPTLESKKGKKRPIGDTIVHARTLPQQTTLKYRADVPFTDILGEGEQDTKRLKHKSKDDKSAKEIIGKISDEKIGISDEDKSDEKDVSDEDVDDGKIETNDDDNQDTNNSHIPKDTNNEKDNNDNTNEETNETSDESEESEFDDETDTEALLEELNKIKQEKQRKEQAPTNPNPLIDQEPKKSWRSSTFKKSTSKPNSKNNDESFTTNSIESEFHQSFLSKYIR